MFEKMQENEIFVITGKEIEIVEENIRNDECKEIAIAMFNKAFTKMESILEYSDDDLLSFEVQHNMIKCFTHYKEMIDVTGYRFRLIRDSENVCGVYLTIKDCVVTYQYFDYMTENDIFDVLGNYKVKLYEFESYLDNLKETINVNGNKHIFIVLRQNQNEIYSIIDACFADYEKVKKYIKDMKSINKDCVYNLVFGCF